MQAILKYFILVGFCVLTLMAMAAIPAYGQRAEDVTIEAIEVREGIYMLAGGGGNIGLSAGEDGAFMIDDQFAPLTPKIMDAVGKITDQPVKLLINTHWHQDTPGETRTWPGRGRSSSRMKTCGRRFPADSASGP